ncbi:2-dehydro-3-deoxygluconokinase [Allocatelliglobosispora scoriae]|uniref:2-dehydro-3-deoxygluconokinase n=1 Tax=Allocatelliglobosispora scoriae TaxID=643052 RepID=A0A841BMJ3_9ACTN|nr:sugar kinase [Allocatelliglobosispora scoriae]MBB5870297.1 2-dehydro-3-deoxygluconokinase [Allocatelliglobosispora scoriae]
MRYDVVVIGEPLIEFVADEPLSAATAFTLGFAGDALNAAVAAAAAGARTALLTRLGSDELSDRLVAYLSVHGVSTDLVLRESGQSGAYVLGADPDGTRAFAYLRAGSAATRLTPADVDAAGLGDTRAVLFSGITAALSESCLLAVRRAARVVRESGGHVVYDPNFRARLTTAEAASAAFTQLAPDLTVALPSAPSDTAALFGCTSAVEAARAVHERGTPIAVVTQGHRGVAVSERGHLTELPVVPAPHIVDATGAGDSFAGTLTARLALGDDLLGAVRLGTAAASLALGGRGGTGHVASLAESRAHLSGHATV